MGQRADNGQGRAISDDAATIAAAAAATSEQDDEYSGRYTRPEISLPEMREVLLAVLLDVPALSIRVRLIAAFSVPVLRPREQVVPLDLQSYQEDPSGAESRAEQALLVHSGKNIVRCIH